MGDMSELKPLITIGVFTTILLFLILQIPAGLYDTSARSTIRDIEYLDYWDAGTLRNYADFNETVIDPDVSLSLWRTLPDYVSLSLFSQELDDGDGEGEVEIGGYEEVWLLSRYTANTSEGRIYVAYPSQRFLGLGWVTRWSWGEFYWNNGSSIVNNQWAYGGNQQLNKKILADFWEEVDDTGEQLNYSSFKVKMNYEDRQIVWFDIHFSFNTSLYGDPQFAWDNSTGDSVPDDLWVLTGMNFDQTRTTYDAWGLIEAILFFNLPSILEGTPAFIGYILSIIVWIPIIYVTYILLLRSIGALFGGGA